MTFPVHLAMWIDSQAGYWRLAWVVVPALIALTLLPLCTPRLEKERSRLHRCLSHPSVLLLAFLTALLALRWPLLFIPQALNPDESQGIAQAITILHDPVFYRSVQSGSAGPLWTYPIALPGLLGLDINYATTRFVGILMLWSALVALYFAVRQVSGELSARIAAWPALLCFALPVTRDFLHYSSEYPTLPLIACGAFLYLHHLKRHEHRPFLVLFLLGLALGAVPFAKLQATVIALPIAIFATLKLLRAPAIDRAATSKRLAALVSGAVTVPLFFITTFLLAGVFGYFWTVYIVNNLHYAERRTPALEILHNYLTNPIGLEPVDVPYRVFILCVLVFAAVRLSIWIAGRRNSRTIPWAALAFAGVLAAAAVYAVAAPGRPFPHYLHLVVVPFALLCGVLMHEPASHAPRAAGALHRLTRGPVLGTLFLLVPMLALLLRPLTHGKGAFLYPGPGQLEAMAANESTPPGPFINRHKKPGDRLSVWGWFADYHVDTQLPMGTRSAVTEFHIRDVPLRDYYRQHYLEEFRRREPAFFIDATGPLSLHFTDRALYGHETFPELAAWVQEHYVLFTDADTPDTYRLYIRRDRAESIRASIEAAP